MNKYVEALEEVKTEGRKFKNQSAIEEALEKQIPMKVSQDTPKYIYYCPACNKLINHWVQPYCGECGQALEWSKE